MTATDAGWIFPVTAVICGLAWIICLLLNAFDTYGGMDRVIYTVTGWRDQKAARTRTPHRLEDMPGHPERIPAQRSHR
jgi:hypothetical protein